MAGNKKVGVLALQGAVAEHLNLVQNLGYEAAPVRTAQGLEEVQGLILPGGESSTIEKLAKINQLFDPIRAAALAGLPILGTCAGLILMADKIVDPSPGQVGLGILEVTVKRNAFGSQIDSFETEIKIDDHNSELVAFIRAPVILEVAENVKVLATLTDGAIVGVQQENLMALSFHPELTGAEYFHRQWLQLL